MALRVGLAGFGLAGEVFHAPLIDAVDGLDLAAIVTSDSERAARARSAHPAARVVPSLEDLWTLGLDVVVIATPNRTHVPAARAALAHGLAVVVDKPLAVTAAEAAALVAEADGRLTVFQNRRWDGDFLTARRLIAEGALGDVLRFESRFERFRPEIKEGWRERGDAEEGGGQLLDLGSHLVDQALVLFGPQERVYGEVAIRRPGALVEDDAFIALEHAGGVRSHLWMSAVAPLGAPRLAVSGLRAGFACDGLDPQEDQLRDGLRPGAPEFGRRGPGRLADGDGERPQEIDRGDYTAFYAGVRDWLRGGAPPPVDPRDAVAALQVLEAARAAAEAE